MIGFSSFFWCLWSVVCVPEGKGREGKEREWNGREGKGREGKGREGGCPVLWAPNIVSARDEFSKVLLLFFSPKTKNTKVVTQCSW